MSEINGSVTRIYPKYEVFNLHFRVRKSLRASLPLPWSEFNRRARRYAAELNSLPKIQEGKTEQWVFEHKSTGEAA